MRNFSFPLLIVGLILFLPFPIPAQTVNPIPPAVVQAFNSAGLPVLRQRINAIEFSASLPDGTVRKLSDLKGKVVFLNFWATWCGPCRQEMPSMNILYQRLKNQGLEILAVNSQEGLREVSAFMRNGGLSFETPLDSSGEISRKYGISAIPTTFIIDRDGTIIARVVGSLNWDTPRITAAFESLLKN